MDCTIKDIQYAAKVFVYFEVNEDGTPNYNQLDYADLVDAVREPYEDFWTCNNCGQEWDDNKEVLKHLEKETK
jgi:hypothetical protein